MICATLMSVGAFIYLYLKLTKSKKNKKLPCNSKFSATAFLGVLCFLPRGFIYIYITPMFAVFVVTCFMIVVKV